KGFLPTSWRSSCRTATPGAPRGATSRRRSPAGFPIRSSSRKVYGWTGSPLGTWAMLHGDGQLSESFSRPRMRAAHWRRSAGSSSFDADSNHFEFLRLPGEDLLRAGGAHGPDGDLEEEALAGEGMVQVHQHGVGAHLAHGDRIALAAGGASVETEAGPQVDLAGEEAAGKRDHVVFLARTVRVLGGDAERGLLPLAQSLQRLFQ